MAASTVIALWTSHFRIRLGINRKVIRIMAVHKDHVIALHFAKVNRLMLFREAAENIGRRVEGSLRSAPRW